MTGLRGKKGFTLIEVMLSVAILAVLATGVMVMFQNSVYMWESGLANLSLNQDARKTIKSVSTFVRLSQGLTIKITRYGPDQPANSCIMGKLAETAFVTTDDPGGCGCDDENTDYITGGDAGHEFMIYQLNNQLIYAYPSSITVPSNENVTYDTYVLSNNLEQLSFGFMDSQDGRAINVQARFSKDFWNDKPPAVVSLKKTVLITHFHSAGFYLE